MPPTHPLNSQPYMDPCLPSDLTSCASAPHSLRLNILTSSPVLRWPDSSLFSHCSPCLEILSLEICMAPSSLTFKSWLKCNLSSEIPLFTLCFTWQPALAHTAWNSWFLWLCLLFFLSQILALVNMDITLFEIILFLLSVSPIGIQNSKGKGVLSLFTDISWVVPPR